MALITIGIPFYNAERFIEDCVRSVLNQTYQNIEIILLDDGSKDSSLQKVKQFNDARIKIVTDGENKGLIFRLNQLVTISKGDYFARMDADDLMFPDRIEKQLKLFISNLNVDVVFGDAVSIDKENTILGYKKSQKLTSRKDVLKGVYPIHPTVMIRREILLENPYEEGYFQMEDMELWYRLVDKYSFISINEPLLFYREDSSNNSRKHLKMIKGKLKFADTYKETRVNKIKMVIVSFAKYIIYFVLEILRKEYLLLNKRFRALNQSEKEIFKQKLDSVINDVI
jgi:glycosyltransferase involved in cell wall biosynthesis